MIKNKTAKNKMDIINTSSWENWIAITNIAYLITLALTVIFVGLNIFWSGKLSDAKDHNFEVNKSRTDSTMADLTLQAENAHLETEELKQQNIELNLMLEKEKSRRLQVEQELKSGIQKTSEELKDTKEKAEPRSLTKQQQDDLVNFLSIYPTGEINIEAMAGNKESVNFARQIETAFYKAGYKIKIFISGHYAGELPLGINLLVKNQETAPEFTSKIQQAFTLIGLEALADSNNTREPNSLTIRIGYKP